MAKDDYFVLAYRILTYIYACIKSGVEPDIQEISFTSLDISEYYWEYIIRHLYQEGYVEGVVTVPVIGRRTPKLDISNMLITPKGIEFLTENSSMKKAKDFLKTIKEIIPGL